LRLPAVSIERTNQAFLGELRGKTMHWNNMTDSEKLELVRRDMNRIEKTLSALLSELDVTWNAMKETRSELGKINKEVATLRALWPQKYSRTG
jgi:hypothetical protein